MPRPRTPPPPPRPLPRGPDPTGAATGTAADVAVKDAANPTLAEVMETVGHNKISINFVWTLLTGFLVMFMQAGFAMVETGFTRAKNAAHTMIDELHGLPHRHVRLLGLRLRAADGRRRRRGRARRHGAAQPRVRRSPSSGRPSASSARAASSWAATSTTSGVFALFLFQMVFMDTAVTIPTGAMAERWKWSSFLVYGFFMSMVVYPLFGNWVWGGGWLADARARTSASATATWTSPARRSCTWSAASPRSPARSCSGRASASSTRTASRSPFPATTSRWRIVGTFILAFGWFGFNPGSTLAGTDLRIAVVATNTMLAGAGGALTAMLFMMWRFGKPDPSDDGERHARRPRGDHRALRVRDRAGRRADRRDRRRPGRACRSFFVERHAEGRRPGRRDLGPRRQRRLGRHLARPLRRRHVRRRLERRRRAR